MKQDVKDMAESYKRIAGDEEAKHVMARLSHQENAEAIVAALQGYAEKVHGRPITEAELERALTEVIDFYDGTLAHLRKRAARCKLRVVSPNEGEGG